MTRVTRLACKCLILAPVFFFFVSPAFCSAPTPTFTVTPGTWSGVINNTIVNGFVYAVTITSDAVYLGGKFNRVGVKSGTGAKVGAVTGSAVPGFPAIGVGSVRAAVPDGQGGWYVGGEFTSVAGLARPYLAHIFFNGSLDPAFNPAIPNQVYALQYDAPNNALYCGGNYLIRKFDGTTGAAFPGFAATTDGTVNSMLYDSASDMVYVGGSFYQINGITRNAMARIYGSSGATDTGFICELGGSHNVYSIAMSGASVYIGGYIQSVNGTARKNLAKIDPVTGAVDMTFNPSLNSYVFAICPVNADLYIGGQFTSISGTVRNYIAKVDGTYGLPDASFNPGANGFVRALSSDGANIYAGGEFTSFGGTAKSFAAKFAISGGAVDALYLPDPNKKLFVSCYDAFDGMVYLGGEFTMLAGIYRDNIAKISLATGLPDAVFAAGTNNTVNAITCDNSGGVFIGGTFNSVNGTERECLAKVDAITGGLDPLNAPVTGGEYVVNSLFYDQDTSSVFIGGDFTTVSGQSRICLAKINSTTGAVDPLFKPIGSGYPADNPILGGQILALAVSGDSIYFGGYITRAINISTCSVMKAYKADGQLDMNFNPQPASEPSSVYAILCDGPYIYAGGFDGLFRLNAATSALDTAFTAACPVDYNGCIVRSLARDSSGGIYAGGGFSVAGGFSNLVRIYGQTGFLDTTFRPNPIPGYVEALAISGNILHAGGSFNSVSGTAQQAYSRLWIGGPVTPTITMTFTITRTFTDTFTPTSTRTLTMTLTPTISNTHTESRTHTISPTILNTRTSTRTFTSTRTATPPYTATITSTSTIRPPAPTPTFTNTPGGYYTLLNSYITNGAVYAITRTASSVYIGGAFSRISSRTGHGVVLDSAGALVPGFPQVAAGKVKAAVPDGSGGWFIGGDFMYVNGQQRTRLAHIYGNGSLDPVFTLGVGTAVNEWVNALAYDGLYLYVACVYDISGNSYLVKINPWMNTVVTAFAPGLNGVVSSMALDGNNLYIGGYFTSVKGQARNRIAKISALTGEPDPVFTQGTDGAVNSLILSGGSLYIGGVFTSAGGLARKNTAKLDAATGAADPAFNTWTNGNVMSLASDGSGIFMAGNFTIAGGYMRNFIAKTDAATGVIIQGFNPDASNTVNAVYFDGSKLYAGGLFTSISGQQKNYGVRMDPASGTLDPGFNPDPNNPVFVFNSDGTNIFMGGEFTGLGGFVRNNAAKLDEATGAVDTVFVPDLNGTVYAAAFDGGGNVYFGGEFTSASGSERNRLVKVSALTGAPDPAFFPGLNDRVTAINLKGQYVYAAGYFNKVNGITKINLAKISALNGSLDATYDIGLTDDRGTLYAMAGDSNYMYITGNYYMGPDKKINVDTGLADPGFSVDVDDDAYSTRGLDSGFLYLGGTFQYVHGVNRLNAARVDAATGMNVDPLFDPQVWYTRSFGFDTASVYTGGGEIRKTDKVTGVDDMAFSHVSNDIVYALSSSGARLHVGGGFSELDKFPLQGYAVIYIGTPPTATRTPAYSPTRTPTPTRTATNTIIATFSFTRTSSLTRTASPTKTATSTMTSGSDTATFTRSPTQYCTVTPTYTITQVPVFPTLTFTPSGINRLLDQVVTDGTIYAITATANDVFIGGGFTKVGTNTGACLMLDAVSGARNPQFPRVAGTVNAIIADKDGGWYIAGAFTGVAGLPRNNVAHIFANYALDPSFVPPAINGPVMSLAFDGSSLFIGGDFDNIAGSALSGMAKLNPSNGAFVPGFNAALNYLAIVNTMICSNGAVYAGGSISTAGGIARSNLIRVNADSGALDVSFFPKPNSTVLSIALNNNSLYLGGLFWNIEGTAIGRAAKIDPDTGALDTMFSPNTSTDVRCVVPCGTDIFIAGNFSAVGGLPRMFLAKVNGATGAPDTSFNMNINLGYTYGDAGLWSLACDGAYVYAGGLFEGAGGLTRPFIAKASITTGAVESLFNPGLNDRVNALCPGSAGVVAGGAFNAANMTARTSAAKINASTGLLDPDFNPVISGSVYSLAYDSAGLFMGGYFTQVNGYSRQAMAKVRMDTGELDLAFNADTDLYYYSAYPYVYALVYDGGYLYMGGEFDLVRGIERIGIAKVDGATGQVDMYFNPGNKTVRAIAIDGQDVYLGGNFSSVAGQYRLGLAKVNKVTGALDYDFIASAYNTYALAFDNGYLYSGGPVLQKLDPASGQVITAFNPGTVSHVFSLLHIGGYLYAGGSFTTAGGQPARHVARFMDWSGALDTSLTLGADAKVNVVQKSPDGSVLYAGGDFIEFNFMPAAHYAAFYAGPPVIPTVTQTGTVTLTATITRTPDSPPTPTVTPTAENTASMSATANLSLTQTEVMSPTVTATIDIFATGTFTVTATLTCTNTPVVTFTATATPTHSATITPAVFTQTEAVLVYPNPSKGAILVSFREGMGAQQVELSIYTVNLRLIKRQLLDSNPENRYPLALTGQANGTYVLAAKLIKDGAAVYRKVMPIVVIK